MQYYFGIVTLLCLAVTAQAEVAPNMKWENALKPKGPAAQTLTLSSNGATDYTVVLPMAPTTRDQKAADDLCTWLKAMTGVSFPVVKDGAVTNVTGKIISIGKTSRVTASGFSGANLGTEGYAIEVAGENLFLLGGSMRGAINAVYALLEEDLGCRWYARGTATIPRVPTLQFRPVSRRFVPVLEVRDPYYSDAFEGTWSLRNRTNARGAVIPEEYGGYINYASGLGVHTFVYLVPPDRYFKDHPEYFSENDGKRNKNQLCVSNPDVLQVVIARVKEILKENPNAELISVSQNDGTPCCACPNCKKITDAEGSLSGPLLIFVNGVADAIAQDFPNVKVSTLAYLDTFMPPKTVKPRPNVEIQLCTDSHAWDEPFLAIPETKKFQTAMKGWAAIGANIQIWDYTVNFSHYLAPMPNMQVVTEDIRFFFKHNAKGIMLQGAYQSPGASDGIMKSWVWAKQLWDPTRDTQALIRDFTYGYFGAAAEPMLEYQDLMWQAWEQNHKGSLKGVAGGCRYTMDLSIFTREFLAKSTAMFDRAQKLAADDETMRRVKLAKLPIMYVQLSQGIGFITDGGEARFGNVLKGKVTDGTDYKALLDEFAQVVKTEGITHFAEAPTPDAEKKISFWRETLTVKLPKVSAHRIGDVWKFKPDADKAGINAKWYAPEVSDTDWTEVRSDKDCGWEKQGFSNYLGYGWYRQKFQVPPDFSTEKFAYLLFEAVDEDAEVWINGKKAFEHTCASTGLVPAEIWVTPFMFDPRPFLDPGKQNLIALRILNTAGMGGIWKPVYLISTDVASTPRLIAAVIRNQLK